MARARRAPARASHRALQERPLEALLHRPGFPRRMRNAIATAQRWAKIAPRPEERSRQQLKSPQDASGGLSADSGSPCLSSAITADCWRGSQWRDRRRERRMAAANGSEQQILDWLAGQRDAMLALLETLVNTDSGSYDKAGRRRGRRPHPQLPRRARHRERGDARRQSSATPSRATVGHRRRNRPILLMGHRDTVFPEGRADAPAVQDRRRPRLWSGRRRHEGRPGDELLRARRAQEVRRRAARR